MALSKEAREFFAKCGRKGAKQRLEKMTPEERKQVAQKAAQARWKPKQKPPGRTP